MTAHTESLALTQADIDRFWGKVEKTPNCWLRTATTNKYGYAIFTVKHKNYKAHRIALFMDKGIEPTPGHTSHICGNRRCVNPSHLKDVSYKNHLCGNRNRHKYAMEKNPPLTFGNVEGEPCVFVELPNGKIGIADVEWAEFIGKENCQYSLGYMEINKSKVNPERQRRFHRIVCGASEGTQVDHINGNRLDNRRSNLRIVDSMQNNWNQHSISPLNKSGKTGVSWHEKCQKWLARITVNSKKIHLGVYVKLEDAIVARRQAELKYYGEYAPKEVVLRIPKR